MNAKFLFALLAVTALIGGCQTIYVQDTQGNPINGAAVWTVAEAGNTSLFKQKTMFGAATLSISMEPPGSREYLHVSKDGYLPRRKIRSADWNDTVTMRKVLGHPDGEQVQPKKPEKKKPGWDLDLESLWKKTEPKPTLEKAQEK
jgi:hypothetical protein